MEAHVKEVFLTDIDPEVFAANDGVGWLNLTFNDYHFQDQQLDQWIHAVGTIICDPAKLEEVQRKYLSTHYREEVFAEQVPFVHLFARHLLHY